MDKREINKLKQQKFMKNKKKISIVLDINTFDKFEKILQNEGKSKQSFFEEIIFKKIDKQAYEGKQRYAERKMEEQRKKQTLTEEQHDLLAELCAIRHKIHSMDANRVYASEAFESNEFDKFVFEDYADVNDINHRIEQEFGKKAYEYENYDYNTIYNDNDVDDAIEDEELTEDERDERLLELMDEAFKNINNIKERINQEIEEFLREIDEDHGTNYAPTGITRLYLYKK